MMRFLVITQFVRLKEKGLGMMSSKALCHLRDAICDDEKKDGVASPVKTLRQFCPDHQLKSQTALQSSPAETSGWRGDSLFALLHLGSDLGDRCVEALNEPLIFLDNVNSIRSQLVS
jgi:hypothetical protein